MRQILRFYHNEVPANDRLFYLRDDIINKWSDFRLQTRKNYLSWFYPDLSSKKIIYKFRTNVYLRKQVLRFTVRFMLFLGFTVTPELDVKNIKPIYREENGVTLGLYNPNTFLMITRILEFLREIHMSLLGALLFLCICKAIKTNPDLGHIIGEKDVFQDWAKTQPYLEETRFTAQENLFGEELEDWEKNISEENIEKHDAWDD